MMVGSNSGRVFRGVLVAAVVVLLAGCMTTRNAPFVEVNALVARHEYKTAANILSGPRSSEFYDSGKDQVLFNLDLGSLSLYGGDFKNTVKYFNEAERYIEEYFTKSISNAAASFLLNDTSLEYSGETYEDLYLNVFKAVAFARTRDFDGAFVEIRRMGDKLNLLEDKYGRLAASMNSSSDAKGKIKAGAQEFHNSALARYLSAILYRADGKIDDAAIDLKKLAEAFKSQPKVYNFPEPKFDGMLTESDKARINVVAFTGRGPAKKAKTIRLNTARDLVVITFEKEDANGRMTTVSGGVLAIPGISEGFNFKCQTPEMVRLPSSVAKALIIVDGKPAGELSLLESMENVAIETFKLRESIIFTKTIIRTAVKGVAAGIGKQKLEKAAGGSAGGLLLSFVGGIAADVAVEASEKADLRIAGFFPGRAWVGEVLVTPGKHDLAVRYLNGAGSPIWEDRLGTQDVTQKGLNLWPSFALY